MTLDGWTPKDYEGPTAGAGFCEMEYCLGNSLNLPAVRTEYALGVLPIANLAVDAGVSLLSGGQLPRLDRPTPSPWGRSRSARSTSPTGRRPSPTWASTTPRLRSTKITDAASGGRWSTTYNAAANAQRVVPENVAYIMDETLSVGQVPPAGVRHLPEAQPCRAARSAPRPGPAGRATTTSTTGRSAGRPTVLTAVWVGDPQGESAKYGLSRGVTSGVTGAAPIWQTYMEGATASTPVVWYQQPSDVYEAGGAWYLPGTGRTARWATAARSATRTASGRRRRRTSPFTQPLPSPPRRPGRPRYRRRAPGPAGT